MLKWTAIALAGDDPWQDHAPVEVWPDHGDRDDPALLWFSTATFTAREAGPAPTRLALLLGTRIVMIVHADQAGTQVRAGAKVHLPPSSKIGTVELKGVHHLWAPKVGSDG